MANSDKNILITPSIGSTTADPKIVFSGANASLGPQNITLQVYPTSNGTLSFEGSAGQLFSITNNMSGTIFSANDVSGIPSIEVLDTGLVKLAQYSGNVLLGTGTDNGTDKLQVTGNVRATTFYGAGTGLTGTAASLSIGGNATTAGGLAVHTSTNNEANKIVRTDVNGYIQAGWINSISGDNGTTTPTRIYASQDGYIRYYSVANFRQVIDVPTRTGGNASGTWAISISGNAATATSATSATSATTATTATVANTVNSPDGDRNAATKLPTTSGNRVRFDFVGAASAGTGGNYAGVMTYAPWAGTTASTGDASYQLAFGSTAANGGGIPQLNIRKGIDSTWNSWYTLIHTGNISTYSSSPTLQTLTIDSNGNLDYNKYDSSSTATINIKNVPLNFTGSGTLSFSSNDLILTL
jgi:hypothetical protein